MSAGQFCILVMRFRTLNNNHDDDAWKVAQVPTEESFHPIWLPLAAALNQTTPPISSPFHLDNLHFDNFHFDNFHFDNFHFDFMPSSCENCMTA